MGTNYYFLTGEKHRERCSACGFTHLIKDKLHIGKSSIGRYFTLHGITEKNLVDLQSWMSFIKSFPKGKIVDEYGREVSIEKMCKIITREDYAVPLKAKKPGTVTEHNDIYGEKGLVYYNGEKPAPDGLYVVINDVEFS